MFLHLPKSFIHNKPLLLADLLNEYPADECTAAACQLLLPRLHISLSEGYVSIDDIGSCRTKHYLSASEVSMASLDEIRLHCNGSSNDCLLKMLEHPTSPVRHLTLEVHDALGRAFDIIDSMNKNENLFGLTVTCSAGSAELADEIRTLSRMERLANLSITIGDLKTPSDFLVPLSQIADGFRNLDSLELNLNPFPRKHIEMLSSFISVCTNLLSLTLHHVNEPLMLSLLAAMRSGKLRRLSLSHFCAPKKSKRHRNSSACLTPDRQSSYQQREEDAKPRKLPRSISANSLSCDLRSLCGILENRSLTTLSLTHSCFEKESMSSLLDTVARQDCSLKGLVMDYCLSPSNALFEVDLSCVTPPGKTWDVLDFSGWSIVIAEKSTSVGGINKLVILGATFPQAEWRHANFVDLFSVRRLHCNYEHLHLSSKEKEGLLRSSQNSLEALVLTRSSSDAGLVELPSLLSAVGQLPALKKLQLGFRPEDIQTDENLEEWTKFVQRVRLQKLTLVLGASTKDDDDASASVLKLASIAIREGHLTNLKVLLDSSYAVAWSDNRPLLDDAHNAMTNGRLSYLSIRQPKTFHEKFLRLLEEWELEHDVKFEVQAQFDKKEAEVKIGIPTTD